MLFGAIPIAFQGTTTKVRGRPRGARPPPPGRARPVHRSPSPLGPRRPWDPQIHELGAPGRVMLSKVFGLERDAAAAAISVLGHHAAPSPAHSFVASPGGGLWLAGTRGGAASGRDGDPAAPAVPASGARKRLDFGGGASDHPLSASAAPPAIKSPPGWAPGPASLLSSSLQPGRRAPNGHYASGGGGDDGDNDGDGDGDGLLTVPRLHGAFSASTLSVASSHATGSTAAAAHRHRRFLRSHAVNIEHGIRRPASPAGPATPAAAAAAAPAAPAGAAGARAAGRGRAAVYAVAFVLEVDGNPLLRQFVFSHFSLVEHQLFLFQERLAGLLHDFRTQAQSRSALRTPGCACVCGPCGPGGRLALGLL